MQGQAASGRLGAWSIGTFSGLSAHAATMRLTRDAHIGFAVEPKHTNIELGVLGHRRLWATVFGIDERGSPHVQNLV